MNKGILRHKFMMVLAVLGGFIVTLGQVPFVSAASSTSFTINITPPDNMPPEAVADFAGSSGAEGQGLLAWTAPQGDAGGTSPQTVSSYIVRTATFSVDMVGGSTTTWWNNARDISGEPPPLATGTLQSMILNNLEPGAVLYFAVKSRDRGNNVSPIDVNAVTPGMQASITVFDTAPPAVAALTGTAGDALVDLAWSSVTAADFSHYRLEVDSTEPRDFTDLYVATTTVSTSFTHTGLTNGLTYAYRVIAVDKGAPTDVGVALDSAPSPVAEVFLPIDRIRPAPVAGITALTNPDGTFSVDWAEVLLSEDGTQADDVVGYRVYRSTGLLGPYSVQVSSSPGVSATGFQFTASSLQDEFYLIVAVDEAGNESDPATSNYLHVTPQGVLGQIGLASDGTPTRAYVPQNSMPELKNSREDVLIRVTRNNDPVMNADTQRTLRTYSVDVTGPVSTVPDRSFAFTNPAMHVTLQYEDPVSSVTYSQDEVGILWWNGTRWIKMGRGVMDPVLKTISFHTALTGTYQARQYQAATELTLDKSSVFPRIFSPNGDGINDMVFFVIENPRLSAFDAKIYDMTGGFVADMKPAVAGAPTIGTMVWDGKDSTGQFAPAGPYHYQIKGEDKVITGTIVIAK